MINSTQCKPAIEANTLSPVSQSRGDNTQTSDPATLFALEHTIRIIEPSTSRGFMGPTLYACVAEAFHLTGEARAVPPHMWIEAPCSFSLHLFATGDSFSFQIFAIENIYRDVARDFATLDKGLRQLGSLQSRTGFLGGNFELCDKKAAQEFQVSEILSLLTDKPTTGREFESKTRIRIRFKSMLRIRHATSNMVLGHHFLDKRCFCVKAFMLAIQRRMRLLGIFYAIPEGDLDAVQLVQNKLLWLETSYGSGKSRKVFGGAVGEIVLENVCVSVLKLLKCGMWTGAGELTRMGFGRYEFVE